MSPQFRNRVVALSTLLVLGLSAVATPSAYAGMISSQAVQAPGNDRERVKALLARPEVAAEMQKMGLAPGDAVKRVDAMSDAEVTQLAGRLDALPAGGAITNEQLLLIIIIIILLIILL